MLSEKWVVPMDAVKAVSEIDGEKSIANQSEPELEVDFDGADVAAINAIAYIEGSLTEEVVEKADVSEETEEKMREMLDRGSAWEDLDLDSEDIDLDEIMEAAEDMTLSEEEMRTLIEIQDKIGDDLEKKSHVEGQLIEEEMIEAQPAFYKELAVAAYGVAVVVAVLTMVDATP